MKGEHIRRFARVMLGSNSPIYQSASIVADTLSICWKEGLRTHRALKRIDTLASSSPVAIKFKKLEFPIMLRPRTEDSVTAVQNIVREEYGQMNPGGNPQWMIDAGAYIGDTTAYFLSRFSTLRAIALEPNPDSYDFAKMNLEPYGERCSVLKKALWSKPTKLKFSGESTGAAISESGFDVDCTSIRQIASEYNMDRIDILKIDVEGAEKEVFSGDTSWLEIVGLLVMEIHGPHILNSIADVLTDKGFAMQKYRSVWYCQRLN